MLMNITTFFSNFSSFGSSRIKTISNLRKGKNLGTKCLESLAELNRRGKENEWEFNEWFHGETLEPRGKPYQARSASMYVYAYEAMQRKDAIFFRETSDPIIEK